MVDQCFSVEVVDASLPVLPPAQQEGVEGRPREGRHLGGVRPEDSGRLLH